MATKKQTFNKRINTLESKANETDNEIVVNVIWHEIGEEREPPEPGTLIIYLDQKNEARSYRYDPTKPNGGKHAEK